MLLLPPADKPYEIHTRGLYGSAFRSIQATDRIIESLESSSERSGRTTESTDSHIQTRILFLAERPVHPHSNHKIPGFCKISDIFLQGSHIFSLKLFVDKKKALPLHPQSRKIAHKGAIAQLVEQRTENPCVPGSIPGGTT